MITPKIKNLFHFIEFLHSNIENFNRYEKEINELYLLDKERQKLNPNKNFAEKMEYDKIQLQIKNKHKVFQDNIIQPIKDKANELNICNPDESPTLWNYNISEILELKENFESEDLPVIFSHKNKYIEYRTKTKGEAFFGLGWFFDDLDHVLKELFNYFKETEQNEFEAFETKAIQVNDIGEAVKLFQYGKFQKFTLPNSFLNPSTIPPQTNIEPLPPQPINSEIDTEKYTAKHYLLAYLFECNAKGVSYPIGNKKELERIGNERMGAGKGNRFYKVFNEVINKDLNAEKSLFEIGGEYWRKAVIELSKAPELVENYLQSKQL